MLPLLKFDPAFFPMADIMAYILTIESSDVVDSSLRDAESSTHMHSHTRRVAVKTRLTRNFYVDIKISGLSFNSRAPLEEIDHIIDELRNRQRKFQLLLQLTVTTCATNLRSEKVYFLDTS